jgi:hypothetical protein
MRIMNYIDSVDYSFKKVSHILKYENHSMIIKYKADQGPRYSVANKINRISCRSGMKYSVANKINRISCRSGMKYSVASIYQYEV